DTSPSTDPDSARKMAPTCAADSYRLWALLGRWAPGPLATLLPYRFPPALLLPSSLPLLKVSVPFFYGTKLESVSAPCFLSFHLLIHLVTRTPHCPSLRRCRAPACPWPRSSERHACYCWRSMPLRPRLGRWRRPPPPRHTALRA